MVIWPRISHKNREPKGIEPRALTQYEARWIRKILESNEEWKEADISQTQVIAECNCDDCQSVYLGAPISQNLKPGPMMGYIGMLQIVTDDDFYIEVTLDQSDRKLHQLYIAFADMTDRKRKPPKVWNEKSRVTSPNAATRSSV